MIKTSDYDYYLPEELIAQTPLKNRSESRLMVLNRKNQTIEHKIFSDIVDLFDSNDVLVFNDTKVIPARIMGIKEET
ncbi:MAG: S-adenosylmethionine:tRNA ribosyltransferase-isomerase, partial [Anaeroplasmataceae bacterium]|nr:S-adenosylmethionine:tRNA ribosyltransferase-isomerase [Anaeroplasmataceae bacterium]